jgi:hypothetical protein
VPSNKLGKANSKNNKEKEQKGRWRKGTGGRRASELGGKKNDWNQMELS